jgi:beta-galactosidase
VGGGAPSVTTDHAAAPGAHAPEPAAGQHAEPDGGPARAPSGDGADDAVGADDADGADGAGDADAVVLDADGLPVLPFLASPPQISLWRAPTDNDRIGGMARRWERLGLATPERRLLSVEVRGANRVVTAELVTAGGMVRHTRTISRAAAGGIVVGEQVEVPAGLDDLARVGTVLEVQPGFERMEWFGRGPHETYPDRRRGGRVGLWRSTVMDAAVRYGRPQESGGRADVRWLRLIGQGGRELTIRLDEPRQVSATHFWAADLAAATHDADLVEVATTVVHLDARHRGVGTASCGPDTLPQYLVGPGIHRWTWTFTARDR